MASICLSIKINLIYIENKREFIPFITREKKNRIKTRIWSASVKSCENFDVCSCAEVLIYRIYFHREIFHMIYHLSDIRFETIVHLYFFGRTKSKQKQKQKRIRKWLISDLYRQKSTVGTPIFIQLLCTCPEIFVLLLRKKKNIWFNSVSKSKSVPIKKEEKKTTKTTRKI